MKLYEISNAMLEVFSMLESGDIPEDQLADTIEQLQISFEEKIEDCVHRVRSLQAESDAVKAEIDRLAKMKKSKDNAVTNLKDYIRNEMVRLDIKKQQAGIFKVSRMAGRKSIKYDTSQLPDEFTFYPDPVKGIHKDKVKAALDDGKKVAGAWYETGEPFIKIG